MWSLLFILIFLGACAHPPTDGVTQITEEAIKKKEGVDIRITPFKIDSK